MALADVHRPQVSKYERGEAEPQLEILVRLAKGLGVSIDSLVEGLGWQVQPPRLLIEAPSSDLEAEPVVRPASARRKDVETVTERVYNNIFVVRVRLNELGSRTEEMPIWITEIGWPVRGGGGNPNDKVHWLVDEETQRDLLNSTFSMMKGEQSERFPIKGFRLSAIMYYNIADGVDSIPKGQWDFHCGLIEDSVKPEEGKKRKAWYAFQGQAK
jgi:transcriptional regulator with XRE-family HTH domain